MLALIIASCFCEFAVANVYAQRFLVPCPLLITGVFSCKWLVEEVVARFVMYGNRPE